MKRKRAQIKEKDREVKRVKIDSPIDNATLCVDVVQQIFKSLDDMDLIRVARVCTTWNKASIRERSRFITQRIDHLKLMNNSRTKENPLQLFKRINEKIEAYNGELDLITHIQEQNLKKLLKSKKRFGLSVAERFKVWCNSNTPKEHYTSMCDFEAKGDRNLVHMPLMIENSTRLNGKTIDYKKVVQIVEDELHVSVSDLQCVPLQNAVDLARLISTSNWSDSKEKLDIINDSIALRYSDYGTVEDYLALERYLEGIMEKNLGSFVYEDPYSAFKSKRIAKV